MPQTRPARPAVSVIIPAFRASRDIADALASVFAQTFTDFEVVLVDDGSPDAAELEAAIAPFRSRIHFIAQPNHGAGAARNTAIRASTGRLLAFLDADDRWLPDFLARQVALLESDRHCALVYCDALLSGDTPARRPALHGGGAVGGRGDARQPHSAALQHRAVDGRGAPPCAGRRRPVRRDAAPGPGLRTVAAAGLARRRDDLPARCAGGAAGPRRRAVGRRGQHRRSGR